MPEEVSSTILLDPKLQRTKESKKFDQKVEKIISREWKKYPIQYLDKMSSSDLLRDGWSTPFMFSSNATIDGFEIPQKDKNLYDYFDLIAVNINGDTPIKLVDVATQSQIERFCIDDYVYYMKNRQPEHRLLNLITLELSHTWYSTQILAPRFVREIDWIDQVWPLSRRRAGDYPKVQKYCLAGPRGAYTEFHIDMSGTSVWYHVVFGHKRFYCVEPSNENLKAFEDWMSSKEKNETFYGDLVPGKCFSVDVREGETFLIPSGWIHAVYTVEDSLVFGGNFLHSLSITKQLQIYEFEERVQIQSRYRFPYFKEIHFSFLHELLPYIRSFLIDNENICLFFPVERIFEEEIFRNLALIVKICNMWLQGTHSSLIKDYFSRLSLTPKKIISDWWTVLSSIADKGSISLQMSLDDIKKANSFENLSLSWDTTPKDIDLTPKIPILKRKVSDEDEYDYNSDSSCEIAPLHGKKTSKTPTSSKKKLKNRRFI